MGKKSSILLKGAAVQQMNDELAEDIIASSKNNPLVRLGVETVGVEQLTTLFDSGLTAAAFGQKGFKRSTLKGLGHDPSSPVDTSKPTVIVAAKNMAKSGLRTSRSDMGHEYLHAGIASLAEFKKHNIGRNLEEAIARHHEMVTGSPKDSAIARNYFQKTYKNPANAHKVAKRLYDSLSKKAGSKRDDSLGKRMNE